MIFHRSLSKRKGAAYSFFSGMSSAFIPSAVICVILTGLMALLPMVQFILVNKEAAESLSENAKTAKETFRFLIFGTTDFQETGVIYVILGLLGVFAIITAVRIFNFICDKRTVNVYYSLGIKRMTLFMSKYASGALLLCIAAAVPVILSYIINVMFLGLSFHLFLVAIHFYCGLSVFLLICYSVTAAVFSSVGTVSEAVVYSVAVLFAPTIFIFIAQQIIAAFVPSSTYDVYTQHFYDTGYRYSSSLPSLLESTSLYNPVLFFADEILTFACGMFKDGKTYLTGIEGNWIFPNVFIHFPWFIIACAISVLGALLFKRLKAENCGFLNTNKVLSNLTIFEICIFCTCLFISEIEWNGIVACLGMGAAAAFVAYIIAEIFLKRSFKKILIALYKFVAHMAVIAIILTVCITDVFGFSSYIPDRNKIVSAEIALPFSYSEMSTIDMDFGYNSDGLFRFYEPYRLTYMPVMTTKKDIDTVFDINRKINSNETDDGSYCEIVIRYNLENGKASERRHFLTSREEITLLFDLFESDAYNEELRKLFYTENYKEVLKQYAIDHPYNYVDEGRFLPLAFDYDSSVVIARSPALSENKELKLTKEQFTAFKDAVYTDILAESAYDYFLGTARQVGVISFTVKEEAMHIEGINGYQDFEAPSYYYDNEPTTSLEPHFPAEEATDTYDEETTEEYPEYSLPEDMIPGEYPENLFPEEIPEEIIPEAPSIPPQYNDIYRDYYKGLGGLEYEKTYDVIITENMANTLSFLEKEGFADCFKSVLTVESVSFREYDSDQFFYYYSYNANVMNEFFAYPVSPGETADMIYEPGMTIEESYTENIIKEADRLSELSPLMKLHGYTHNSGYLCLVKYSDGSYCVKFLPENTAPDYVSSYDYTMNSEGEYYW